MLLLMHKTRAALKYLDSNYLCQIYNVNITTLYNCVRALVVIARMRDLIIVVDYLATINIER